MPIRVHLPNRAALKSFATADLSCTRLNQRARSAHIIQGLAQHSLLSRGQLCDAGYKVLFEEGEAKVIDGDISIDGKMAMQGQRDRDTGLWTVSLDNTRTSMMPQEYRKRQDEMSNNVYEISKVYDATYYLHASAGSPVKSTFIKSIEAATSPHGPT
jgi:hypothetical protein